MAGNTHIMNTVKLANHTHVAFGQVHLSLHPENFDKWDLRGRAAAELMRACKAGEPLGGRNFSRWAEILLTNLPL